MLRLLFIGDVYGRPGRRVLCDHLPTIRSRFDFVIANGENAAGGFGLNRESAKLLWDAGVDCITLGNHAFGNREVHGLLDDPRVVRPMNYPLGTPGHGWWTFSVRGEPLTVVNALGRTFMDPVDDPFVAMQDLMERDGLGSVVLDFHAEATSEKAAMAFFLDGRVSAVFGTHTHVATADTRILPGGTAFQTDAGMTGPLDSVIGASPDGPIQRYLTRMPVRFEVGQGRAQLNAVELDLDGGRATRVARYSFTEEDGGRK